MIPNALHSAANNFIYEVTKAFIETSGCQKSGDGLEFNDFLSEKNETLLAECRALGIIGKLICGPLWRILEDQSISFFEMNAKWQILVEKFEEFSNFLFYSE
jgi:hypothetical protein